MTEAETGLPEENEKPCKSDSEEDSDGKCTIEICTGNFIHTYAGMELRLKMYEIMKKQGHEEETGKAKITSGYNLPAKYILHTVGPIIQWEVTGKEEELLASCYRECLKLAADTGAESVAFCCLSTGVFRFPQQRAAEIATETVKNYINEDSRIKKSYLTYSRTMI